MGWASGSGLMSDIISVLKEKVDDEKLRQDIYEGIIPAFEEADCDNLQECEDDDPVFKAALMVVDENYREYCNDVEEND